MAAQSPLEARIVGLIEGKATELGYELVRVRLSGNQRKRLQIMAERASDGRMEIKDCERLSRAVSEIMDAVDPIPSEYTLEVSSPGIDRPLTRERDFTIWAGHDAKIELTGMIAGRKRFRGVLDGFRDGAVLLKTETGEVAELPWQLVHDARLVLTDELIAADLKARGLPPLPDTIEDLPEPSETQDGDDDR